MTYEFKIKCRACGATPDESESIYSYDDGIDVYSGGHKTYYQHRHAYQCVDYLKAKVEKYRTLLQEWSEVYEHDVLEVRANGNTCQGQDEGLVRGREIMNDIMSKTIEALK